MSKSETHHLLNLNPVLIKDAHKALPEKFQQPDGPFKDQSNLPLSQLIPLIINQRGQGSFLNISEESLQKEIDSFKISPDTTNQQTQLEQDIEFDDNSDTYEQFIQKREDIIKYIKASLNESSLSLDFVSLLISCVRPAAGTSSISPHLKTNIKIGSLSSDRLVSQDAHENQQADLSNEEVGVIARGWKLESLEKSIDKLDSFKRKLSSQVRVDGSYCNDLIKILDKKEVLINYGGGSGSNKGTGKEIAVKFGFGDSGSSYFDKGIGSLKKDVNNNGSIFFDKIKFRQQNEQRNTEKIVSIKLYHDTELVGESNLKDKVTKLMNTDAIKVVKDIMKARFFLFEEELFYQLLKEATTLVSLQVSVKDSNQIVIDFHDERIEIEFTSVEDIPAQRKPLKLDKKANEISSFLRIMLCCEHKRNLDKRNIPPVALSSNMARNNTPKTSNILKPLINHTKHNKIIQQLMDILISVSGTQLSAQNFTLEKYLDEKASNDPFARCFKTPFSRLTLLHLNLKVIVEIASSLYSTITVKLYNDKEMLLDSRFNDLNEVEDCLSWCLNYFGKNTNKT
ncbi:unnamed protein product [Ambrosiozyma monospora]|uniref:Unnamed protein product n=1 Tax=Ambrosiozyma monospora TaxID=43982 RepID=A0ACB5SU36_AMBMO|nr:unnamed protein product [Ambrosiozyma monospora]